MRGVRRLSNSVMRAISICVGFALAINFLSRSIKYPYLLMWIPICGFENNGQIYLRSFMEELKFR